MQKRKRVDTAAPDRGNHAQLSLVHPLSQEMIIRHPRKLKCQRRKWYFVPQELMRRRITKSGDLGKVLKYHILSFFICKMGRSLLLQSLNLKVTWDDINESVPHKASHTVDSQGCKYYYPVAKIHNISKINYFLLIWHLSSHFACLFIHHTKFLNVCILKAVNFFLWSFGVLCLALKNASQIHISMLWNYSSLFSSSTF